MNCNFLGPSTSAVWIFLAFPDFFSSNKLFPCPKVVEHCALVRVPGFINMQSYILTPFSRPRLEAFSMWSRRRYCRMGGWRFVIALDDNRNILGACEIVSANFFWWGFFFYFAFPRVPSSHVPRPPISRQHRQTLRRINSLQPRIPILFLHGQTPPTHHYPDVSHLNIVGLVLHTSTTIVNHRPFQCP